MSAIDTTRERVAAGLSGLDHQELEARDGMLTLRVPVAAAREALLALRDRCGFELCTIVTAVDHDEAPRPAEARFEVVWQLQSVAHGDRVRVKAWLAGTEPGAADFSAPSIADLWAGAAYFERECFDMFGIGFEGHEGLRRLLMPEAYEHYPLRKEFPHGGIEPDRLYKAWDRARRQTAGGEA
jgi:NADH:ubiquinone oxidoreductase subunit C